MLLMEHIEKSRHRVLTSFVVGAAGWNLSFADGDGKTALPVRLTLATDDKIRTLYEAYGSKSWQDKQAFEMALQSGNGSTWLNLPIKQYLELRERK